MKWDADWVTATGWLATLAGLFITVITLFFVLRHRNEFGRALGLQTRRAARGELLTQLSKLSSAAQRIVLDSGRPRQELIRRLVKVNKQLARIEANLDGTFAEEPMTFEAQGPEHWTGSQLDKKWRSTVWRQFGARERGKHRGHELHRATSDARNAIDRYLGDPDALVDGVVTALNTLLVAGEYVRTRLAQTENADFVAERT